MISDNVLWVLFWHCLLGDRNGIRDVKSFARKLPAIQSWQCELSNFSSKLISLCTHKNRDSVVTTRVSLASFKSRIKCHLFNKTFRPAHKTPALLKLQPHSTDLIIFITHYIHYKTDEILRLIQWLQTDTGVKLATYVCFLLDLFVDTSACMHWPNCNCKQPAQH